EWLSGVARIIKYSGRSSRSSSIILLESLLLLAPPLRSLVDDASTANEIERTTLIASSLNRFANLEQSLALPIKIARGAWMRPDAIADLRTECAIARTTRTATLTPTN